MQLPRFKIFIMLTGPAILLAVVLSVGHWWLVRTLFVKSLYAVNDGFGIFLVFVTTAALISVIWKWRKFESPLRVSERYLLLLSFGLYMSVLFGVADYGLFRMVPNAFFIREETSRIFQASAADSLLKDKERFECVLRLLGVLKEQVQASGNVSYQLSPSRGPFEFFGNLVIGTVTNRITYIKYDGQMTQGGYIPGRFEVQVDCDGVPDTLPESIRCKSQPLTGQSAPLRF